MEYTIGTKVFGNWEIVCEIGSGANGTVFEIHKEEFGVTAKSALKLIRIPRSSADIRAALSEGMDEQSVTSYFQGFVEEIVKEIALMNEMKSHPNIVAYEDHSVISHAGEIGWDILIRMELLKGLNDYRMEHPMNEAEVVRLGRELCSALVFCQKKGMVHRDIKPENIFVSEFGQFKLGDFGVARTVEKTTGGLSKKGTESYMAPEVYLSQPYGMSVDIYSLGLVLYRFMNGGRLPFLPPYPQPITFAARENALSRRMKGEQLPPPANASREFAEVILKACAYQPKLRYRTAAEMLEALERLGKANGSASAHNAPGTDENEQTIGVAGGYAAEDKTIGAAGGYAAEDKTIGATGMSLVQNVTGTDENEQTIGVARVYETEDKTIGAAGIYEAEDKTIGAASTYAAEDKTIGAAAGVAQKGSAEKAADKAQDAYEAAWESAKQGADKKNRKKTYILIGAAVAAVAVVIGIYAWMARTFDVTVDGELLGSYKKGAQVTLEADAVPEGQKFAGWTVENGDITLANASAEATSFTMPAGEVKVAANYEMVEYAAEVENGSGAGSYTIGEIVEISADAAPEGQKFAGWTVENGDIALADASAETTSFTMPAGEVKVVATYETMEMYDERMKNAWIERCNAFAEKYDFLFTCSLEEVGELLLESGLQIEGEDGEYQDEVYVFEEQKDNSDGVIRKINAKSLDDVYEIQGSVSYDGTGEYRYTSWDIWYYPCDGGNVISDPLQDTFSFMAASDPWEALGVTQEMLDWVEQYIDGSLSKDLNSEWEIYSDFDEDSKFFSVSKANLIIGHSIDSDGTVFIGLVDL